MPLSRRDFLAQSAFACLCGCRTAPSGQPDLRLGIISDIHLRTNRPDAAVPLERALSCFRDRRVDGVVAAGDLADLGTREQLELFARTWRAVFPDDRLPDGSRVEKLFVTGNHDMEWYPNLLRENGETDPDCRKRTLSYGDNRRVFWQELFGETFEPFAIRTVKDYRVVLAQYGAKGLSRFLEEHRAELEGDRPFFYVAHLHPKGTVGAPWLPEAMADDESVTRSLAAFPNAIALTGHSHTTLTDDRMCWRGDFTSIGTGTLFWNIPWGGRENASTFGGGSACVRQMPSVSGKAWQGLLLTLEGGVLRCERHEFRLGGRLGPDWTLPLPHRGGDGRFPCVPAALPQFAADARLAVRRERGKDLGGRTLEQIVVSFPPAISGPGRSRAFDYRVRLSRRDMDAGRCVEKRVYSKAWNLSEGQERQPVECRFSSEEIGGADRLRAEVWPLDCLGRAGAALADDFAG